MNYTLRIQHDETKLTTRWTYVGGDLKDSKGGWTFQEVGPGKTKVGYDVDAQVGFFVPKFVVDKLTASNIAEDVRAAQGRGRAEGEEVTAKVKLDYQDPGKARTSPRRRTSPSGGASASS